MTKKVGFERALDVWPTYVALFICYVAWVAVGVWLYPTHPTYAIGAMAILIAFHSSLQHEAIHGHPTGIAWVNELLVGLPLGIFYPYRRYRATHLAHHNHHSLTDPHHDPESYYHDPAQWEEFHQIYKGLLAINNTFAGRVLIGPSLGAIRFLWTDLRRISHGDRPLTATWSLHLITVGLVLFITIKLFDMSAWAYLLGAYGGASLIGVRSFCEHRWHENPFERTVIVEHSWLSFLFLNNNLHVVHHMHPGLPWFRLPATYAADRDHWQKMNGGYVYKGYASIMARHFLRAKESVTHPAPSAEGRG